MWLFALFPASAAMVLGYAEGLLVMASLVAFLAIRRDRWWLAASAGLVCGLIRPVGLLLVVPFAIEATGHRRASPFARLGAVVAPVIGALSYLFWVGGEYGDWLLPVRVQRELRAGFQDPFTRLWDGFRNLGTSQLDAPNLAFAVIFIGLLVVVFRTQRMSWGFYALATLVVALSAHNINSIGRYGFVAFPFVVAVAKVAEDERVAWAAMAASGAALAALTTMATLGAYQP